MPGALAPHPGAARRPTGDDRIALRHGSRVVVRGVKLGAIHSAVEHCEVSPDKGDAPAATPVLARGIQAVLCAGVSVAF